MKIEELRSVTLCDLPTPLMEMPALSAKLGGPQILIKRDDLTGLGPGGTKVRMFEFLMSEAKDMGADIVINPGRPDGNTSPQAFAAARKLGMDIVFLSARGYDDTIQGNFLLLHLLGAEIKTADFKLHEAAKMSKLLESLAAELRSKGRKPYIVNIKTHLAMAGYARAVSEICQQLQQKGLTAQHLFLATGGWSFQAGIHLGVKYFQAPFKVVGIMHGPMPKEEVVHDVTDMLNSAAKFFEMGFTFTSDEVIVDDGYMGEGYGTLTKKSVEAVKLVAQTEGSFLEPLYTGRVMAALIDQIREGKIKREDTVILYHSGGMPVLYARNEELSGLKSAKKEGII